MPTTVPTPLQRWIGSRLNKGATFASIADEFSNGEVTITRQTVHNWWTGRTTPASPKIARVSEVTRVAVGRLV